MTQGSDKIIFDNIKYSEKNPIYDSIRVVYITMKSM